MTDSSLSPLEPENSKPMRKPKEIDLMKALVTSLNSAASPLPEEPQDFAEEMRAKSWKHWTDAHPVEEPPAELKEALDELQGNHAEECPAGDFEKGVCICGRDDARAALVTLFDRQREEIKQRDEEFDGLGEQNAALVEANASLSSQLERQREEIERLKSSGVDQERSTARTEAPASDPVRGTMDTRIEEIRARLNNTTAGPWFVWDGMGYFGGGRDLCIGAGPTWLANMDHRVCDKRSEHMVALEISHGNVKCEPEIDSAIVSIAETCEHKEQFTAEQEANANFIARAREDVPFLLSVIADLQDEIEQTEWRHNRQRYGAEIAGPEPEPRRRTDAK